MSRRSIVRGRARRGRARTEDRYHSALARLTEAGLTYWCDCSRQRILRESGTTDGEIRYDGHCRARGLGPGPDRGIRVRLGDRVEIFEDALLGPQAQQPSAQCGDLLVRDRLGQWTYQFAVAVDDLADGIDLVIRGLDLHASTGRQIALARLLGREAPPAFMHHGLVRNAAGEKLSKSNGDTGLRELRAAGVTSEQAIGRALAAAGLMAVERPVPAGALAALFRIAR